MNRADLVDVARLGARVVSTRLTGAITGARTHGGVGILINHQGQVLMFFARYRSSWNFPGGWANQNEDPAEAITRELREEVAYPADGPALTIVHSSPTPRHTEYFAMAFVDANVADRLHSVSWEIRSIRWCGPHEMPRLHPRTQDLLSNGEGVLSQESGRWIPGPAAAAALAAAHSPTL